MIDREKRNIIIYDILQPSLLRLYEMDYDNIRFGVSERNICGRLAHHMENIMREYDRNHNSDIFIHYFADVEYNRMGNGELKRYENNEHLPQYMVSDLLIQSRGEPRNLLAVEMKRNTNNREREKDRERLKALVSPVPVHNELKCVYGTLLGTFVIYSAEKVALEFYEDVEGRGTQTGKMEFACIMDGDRFVSLEKVREVWEIS